MTDHAQSDLIQIDSPKTERLNKTISFSQDDQVLDFDSNLSKNTTTSRIRKFSNISTDYEYTEATSNASDIETIQNNDNTSESDMGTDDTISSQGLLVKKSNLHKNSPKGRRKGNLCGKLSKNAGKVRSSAVHSVSNLRSNLTKSLSPQVIVKQPSRYSYTYQPIHENQKLKQKPDKNQIYQDFDPRFLPKSSTYPQNNTEINQITSSSRRRRTRVTDHPENEDYIQTVRLAKRTIDENYLPKLIAQGSSGSYFVQGRMKFKKVGSGSGYESNNSKKDDNILEKKNFVRNRNASISSLKGTDKDPDHPPPNQFGYGPNKSTSHTALNDQPKKHHLSDRGDFNNSYESESETEENENLLGRSTDRRQSTNSFKNEDYEYKLETIAVFKPKNEEPYAVLNPKWTKWIQRNFCFCCFGRSCIIINQGFVSEAAASLVDKHFNINLVPLTGVIRLSSESFYYSKIDRMKAQAKADFSTRFPSVGRKFRRIGLPPKLGSFQLFVKGYQPADYWLRHFEMEPPNEDLENEFLTKFQKLTILDYIIRNTDRGTDNWLIKYSKQDNIIDIAAIDNGLAFPYKHPDAWRTYPYSWSWLEIARKPYTDEIIREFLPKLTNQPNLANLELNIYDILKADKAFSNTIYIRQMSVLRGQILNLQQALRDKRSPAELVQMPPVYVKRAKRSKNVLGRLRNEISGFTQSFQRRKPFFSGF